MNEHVYMYHVRAQTNNELRSEIADIPPACTELMFPEEFCCTDRASDTFRILTPLMERQVTLNFEAIKNMDLTFAASLAYIIDILPPTRIVLRQCSTHPLWCAVAEDLRRLGCIVKID